LKFSPESFLEMDGAEIERFEKGLVIPGAH